MTESFFSLFSCYDPTYTCERKYKVKEDEYLNFLPSKYIMASSGVTE